MNENNRPDRLRRLARDVVETYERIGGINRIGDKMLPSQTSIVEVLQQLLTIVFPGYYGSRVPARANLEVLVASRVDTLFLQLSEIFNLTLHFCHHEPCQCSRLWTPEESDQGQADFSRVSEIIAMDFLEQLPAIRSQLKKDVQAAFEGDPAAVSHDEIILCYPGTFAIAVYRLANPLYRLGVPLVPRIMTEWAHHRTGVDIHPGADIGDYFFIDHGTGVVIGETTEIGERVKLYQGVTLGALSFPKNPDGSLVKGGKRHPTIRDRVTIYANATILGGDTVIGEGAVIGGGSWVTKSVPAGAKVATQTATST
ncbi:MAG: serine acetyltransferase [bacterium]